MTLILCPRYRARYIFGKVKPFHLYNKFFVLLLEVLFVGYSWWS